jgi:hypothetical protein
MIRLGNREWQQSLEYLNRCLTCVPNAVKVDTPEQIENSTIHYVSLRIGEAGSIQ